MGVPADRGALHPLRKRVLSGYNVSTEKQFPGPETAPDAGFTDFLKVPSRFT